MKKSLSTFRCPHRLIVQTQKIEALTGLSFAEIEQRAIRLYIRHLQRNGNRLVPAFTPSVMKPEEKYLGRFTPDETMEDKNDPRPLF
ncbi:MAG: hypothetical protein R3Y56_06755 [Akkermansia sp.]